MGNKEDDGWGNDAGLLDDQAHFCHPAGEQGAKRQKKVLILLEGVGRNRQWKQRKRSIVDSPANDERRPLESVNRLTKVHVIRSQ
jgi:hypothetical protein